MLHATPSAVQTFINFNDAIIVRFISENFDLLSYSSKDISKINMIYRTVKLK